MAQVSRTIDFRIGSNGTPTTLVDLSAKTTEASLNREADLPEATTFNSGNARSYAAGLTNATIEATFMWDATIDAHLKALVGYGTPVSFQHGEIGNTSGYPKATGSCFLQSLDKPQQVGDIMSIGASFQVTGAITDGTYA